MEMGDMADYVIDQMIEESVFGSEYNEEFFAGDICPDCKGGFLVKRTNRKTKTMFLGCSGFPKCRFSCAYGGE